MAVVTVEPGRVRPLWAGHPWVYAQAVLRIEGGAAPGDEVEVVDASGNFLGLGLYSPQSAIPVRIYARERGRHVDASLLRERLSHAIELRRRVGLPSPETNAYRVMHAEGDGWPGLVVDRFGDDLVVQLTTIGTKRREDAVLDTLEELLQPRSIVDRTPVSMAKREGFDPAGGVVRGKASDALEFVERGLEFRLPLALGQKTGYYVDQRNLRERVEALSSGKTVFDAHTYVGSFAMAAARGGAREVVAVDSSAVALETAAKCATANGFDDRIQFRRADARHALTAAGRAGGHDLVICDPPKLASNRGMKRKALAHMRQIASAACRATRPSGTLVISSCASAISSDELTRALALGARDTNVTATILERHFQGPDHPVPASFPEGLYLCSLIAEIRPRSSS